MNAGCTRNYCVNTCGEKGNYRPCEHHQDAVTKNIVRKKAILGSVIPVRSRCGKVKEGLHRGALHEPQTSSVQEP